MTVVKTKISVKKSVVMPNQSIESAQAAEAAQKSLLEIYGMIRNTMVSVQEIYDRINEIKLTEVFNPDKLIFRGKAPIDSAANRSGMTLLVHMAAHRSVEHLQMLQFFGANIGIQNEYGFCAMHMAQSSEVIGWLKTQGISIEVKNKEGDTSLHQLCRGRRLNSSAIMRALIEQGADINARNHKNDTLLHSLMRGLDAHDDYENRCETSSVLVSLGCDVNAKEEMGWTPLHFLSCQRSPLSILSMVRLGADLDISDKSKLRPIHIAANAGDAPSIFALNALGASMAGAASNKKAIDDCLHESRLMSAIRTNEPEILLAHLKIFPDTSFDDVKKSESFIKKNAVLIKKDMGAILNSHLAAQTIDDLLKMSNIAVNEKTINRPVEHRMYSAH